MIMLMCFWKAGQSLARNEALRDRKTLNTLFDGDDS